MLIPLSLACSRYHKAVGLSDNSVEVPMGRLIEAFQLVIAMISLVLQVLPFIK